jgi:hypothetical protein
MATIYKVEVVSHRVNYTPEKLAAAIKKSLEDLEANEISVKAERSSRSIL